MNNFIAISGKYSRFLGLIILLSATAHSGFAQRSDYERLAFRNKQPDIYFNSFTLPGSQENTLKFTTIFRLSYNFLPFKRLNSSTNEAEFSSNAKLNIEVFKSPRKGLRPTEQVSVDNLPSVGRDQWQDIAYAANYDQTQTDTSSISGSLQVELPPGYYTYFLELKKAEGASGQSSHTRNTHLYPYAEQRHGDIILAEETNTNNLPATIALINRGDQVYYGQDFTAFIHLKNHEPTSTYTVQVHRVTIENRDTTRIESLFEQTLSGQQIYSSLKPVLREKDDQLMLELQESGRGFTYALLTIPNHRFPNAVFQLTVTTSNEQKPVAEEIFRSYWADMPTSLLSLDVAIDMLRFVADEATIDRINEGSDRQREQKFREFWKQKDPTPQTEINELQAEYYRRIDYAYEHFTSNRMLGFNSDQGKIYISYGPPNNTNRVYPTDGPTREIWTYANRRFIFQATSGFGDFVLVSSQQ